MPVNTCAKYNQRIIISCRYTFVPSLTKESLSHAGKYFCQVRSKEHYLMPVYICGKFDQNPSTDDLSTIYT